MNFEAAFKKGQQGSNKGISMGKDLSVISSAIGNLQRAMIYVVAAAAKGGKSTLVDAGFVIAPYIDILENNKKYNDYINQGYTKEYIQNTFGINYLDVTFIYNSYEIDRISKEFDFACHFLNYEHGIKYVELEDGSTRKGETTIELCSDYLRGRMQDDNGKIIKVKEKIVDALKVIYRKWIIPLFGEYDLAGNQISKGLIIFLEHRDNPTGVRNFLLDFAKQNGTFTYERFKGSDGKMHQKMKSYTPNNPDKYVFVITDHLRKLSVERNFNLKQTVDKFSEYCVELKNLCKFSFIQIIHLNRSMSDIQRQKYQEDMIYPTSDDIKETGNLAEDCDYLFTMFNPNDDRYNLSKHFGKLIREKNGSLIYPNMRTIHLVESRHCFYPQHFRFNMFGGIKKFEHLKI